jgi:rhamnulose-1-phosphate aldolase/alcohol dehydrogenase
LSNVPAHHASRATFIAKEHRTMPAQSTKSFQHVQYLWDDAVADQLDPVARLVYRSNLLGNDQRITNTGGGNTSAKLAEQDPLTGRETEVLWVKGSGGDLRTAKRENFASLEQHKLLSLQDTYRAHPDNGPKTPIEDEMVARYRHCTFNLNPRASSIDTPLHAFVPKAHIDHMHPNAVIALAAAKNSESLTREIYGDDIVWTPWQRPGFDLGLILQDAYEKNPAIKGVILGQHGIINWDDDDKACYELTLELIEKAARFIEERDKGDATFGGQRHESLDDATLNRTLVEILPWLRGRVSQHTRFIGTVQSDSAMMRFVNSVDASRLAELGTSCPDHFLRTKIKPLFVDFNPQTENVDQLKATLDAGLAQYRKDYADYYDRCKRSTSPAMRDPNPTVVLIPGVGMIAWGKNKSESRVTAEFYNCAVEVMRGAEAIDEYIALPQQEAFDIEYWLLEEAKLKRMPPEKEMARRVVVVVGGGSGIGREVANRVAREGAHVVAVDLNQDAAKATADDLAAKHGVGVGVAGTGLSGCGPSLGLSADVTNREQVKAMFSDVVLAYGGVDSVVITSGIYTAPDQQGRNTDADWTRSFEVNVLGAYIVADEANRIWRAQGLTGSLVITTSVNAVVAKRGSLPYDTSKAAANHLVRELAIELAPSVRVNGVAPATVVDGSSMFPRDRVIASLAKYNISFDENERTESLRDKLAHFYAQRTLMKQPIRPEHQADAAMFLLSDAAGRTTGQIISVDGGLADAFLR